MARLLIDIDDSLLSTALLKTAEQHTSIDSLITDSLKNRLAPSVPPLKKTVSMQDILEIALEKASAYAIGEEFYLDALIDPTIWESMSGGKRKSLGKSFRKEAAKRRIAQHNGRTSGNKAIYIREATKGKMVSVYLPLSLVEKLDRASAQSGQTSDTIVKQALLAWINPESSHVNRD